MPPAGSYLTPTAPLHMSTKHVAFGFLCCATSCPRSRHAVQQDVLCCGVLCFAVLQAPPSSLPDVCCQIPRAVLEMTKQACLQDTEMANAMPAEWSLLQTVADTAAQSTTALRHQQQEVQELRQQQHQELQQLRQQQQEELQQMRQQQQQELQELRQQQQQEMQELRQQLADIRARMGA